MARFIRVNETTVVNEDCIKEIFVQCNGSTYDVNLRTSNDDRTITSVPNLTMDEAIRRLGTIEHLMNYR